MKLEGFDFSASKTYATEENADKAVAKAVASGRIKNEWRYFIVRRPSDARFTPVFITSDMQAGMQIARFGWSVVG